MILHPHFTNNFVAQSDKLYVYLAQQSLYSKTNFHPSKFPFVLNVTPLPYTISQLIARLWLWPRMYYKMLWKHGFQTSFRCLGHWLHLDQSFQIVDKINSCLNGRQTLIDYHSEASQFSSCSYSFTTVRRCHYILWDCTLTREIETSPKCRGRIHSFLLGM